MNAKRVTVRVAKAQLSRLIREACDGHEIVIVRRDVAVAQLVPVRVQGKRQFGAMRGRAKTTAAFFEPMNEAELADWER